MVKEMGEYPLISVILPARNEERYIKPTIESILSQTFSDFELIVVNDASTDKTEVIISGYVSYDNRVKMINNRNLLGVAASINKGIDIAKGKYIARIDAGDIADRCRLQKQVKYMEAFKDVFILGSWSYIINEKKEIIGEWKVPCEVDDRELYKRNGIVHPTVVIRRELFQKIGILNSFYHRAEDYEFWARALRYKFRINNLQEFLTSVMEREKGVSSKYFGRMMQDTFRVKIKYLRCFFNFWNVLSVLRSFAGCILPVSTTNYLVRRYANFLSCKVFLKKPPADKETWI